MDSKKVRGDVLKAYLAFVKKKWGKEGLEECKEYVGIKKAIERGKYYPNEIKTSILEWISQEKGEDKLVEAGEAILENLTILRWMVRHDNPWEIAREFAKEYHEIYSFGEIDIEIQKGKIILRLKDVNETAENCIVWKGITQGLLNSTGFDGTAEKSKCQLEGDDCCQYVIHYKKP